jgi:hypothetical protein
MREFELHNTYEFEMNVSTLKFKDVRGINSHNLRQNEFASP